MMKFGERSNSKLLRGLRHETRRFRLVVLVVGFFLVTFTFIVVSKPESILFSAAVNRKGDGGSGDLVKSRRSGEFLNGDPKMSEPGDSKTTELIKEDGLQEQGEEGKDDHEEARAAQRDQPSDNEAGDDETENCDKGRCRNPERRKVTLPTVSNYTIHDSTQADANQAGRVSSEMPAKHGSEGNKEGRQLCDFSNPRSDVCDMEGAIVVDPSSASVIFKVPTDLEQSELWKVKPYPCKGDEQCLSQVTELTVKSDKAAPKCTNQHDVPGVIFSLKGYVGNMFHDFTDVVVPLFTTASEFDGKVQFLVTDMQPWWTAKYAKVLEKLSDYPIVNLDKDSVVRCFKRVIVGLHAYSVLTIDPTKAPRGQTMVEFRRFMRQGYALERDEAVVLGEHPNVRPRLVVTSRTQSRVLLNIDEVAATAEELGYDVTVAGADTSSDIAAFTKAVNSADVMMGVHGSELTGSVFLPDNAALIQVVPWGAIEWLAELNYGRPAEAMGLKYLEYGIDIGESSLLAQWPEDHEVLKNPAAVHSRGFDFLRETFLDNQNVTLNVTKVRSVLLEALVHFAP